MVAPQVVRAEGAVGLYRGLVPQLVGVAPEKGIKLVRRGYRRVSGGCCVEWFGFTVMRVGGWVCRS